MLLKITESCSLGCTHCMNDAKPCGRDMSFDVLRDTLDFIKKEGTYRSLIVTGGEPTEHREFEKVIKEIIKYLKGIPEEKILTIATNGFWILENQEKAKAIVDMSDATTDVVFQVSTDTRYYPKKLDITKRIWRENGFLLTEDCVQWVYPQGRARDNGFETRYKASSCFNIRAIPKQDRGVGDFGSLVRKLELLGRFCTPSIRVDGSIGLGESDLCPSCSSVYEDSKNIVEAIKSFKCKGCFPLNESLPNEYRRLVE